MRRRRKRAVNAGLVTLCPECIAHFGEGYGPLEAQKLGAVVRFHRSHQKESSDATA